MLGSAGKAVSDEHSKNALDPILVNVLGNVGNDNNDPQFAKALSPMDTSDVGRDAMVLINKQPLNASFPIVLIEFGNSGNVVKDEQLKNRLLGISINEEHLSKANEVLNAIHPLNTPCPNSLNPVGNAGIVFKDEHPEKASVPILTKVGVDNDVTVVNDEHPENVLFGIVVNDAGNEIVVIEEQFLKQLPPNDNREAGKVMVLSNEQLSNALFPILVNVLGNVTDSNDEHPLKVFCPMLRSPVGNVPIEAIFKQP